MKKKPKKKTPQECLVVEAVKSVCYENIDSADHTIGYLFVPAGTRGDLLKVSINTGGVSYLLRIRWYSGMYADRVCRDVIVRDGKISHVRFVGTKKPIEGLELPPLAGRDIGEDDIPF